MDIQNMMREDQPVRRRRALTPEEKIRREMRRKKVRMIRAAVSVSTGIFVILFFFGIVRLSGFLYERIAGQEDVPAMRESESTQEIEGNTDNRKWSRFYSAQLERPLLDVQLLTINDYSRPGEALPEVKSIFIHYTANAGTSAEQNKSYFESLGETHERSASAHFVIGYDGEIVQCIPTQEIAYAVMKRNYDSISIECCYLDEDGRFTDATYESLKKLTAWLLHKFELSPEDVLRHYDEGGKNCPKYYVENEWEWERFILDLSSYMEEVADQTVVLAD